MFTRLLGAKGIVEKIKSIGLGSMTAAMSHIYAQNLLSLTADYEPELEKIVYELKGRLSYQTADSLASVALVNAVFSSAGFYVRLSAQIANVVRGSSLVVNSRLCYMNPDSKLRERYFECIMKTWSKMTSFKGGQGLTKTINGNNISIANTNNFKNAVEIIEDFNERLYGKSDYSELERRGRIEEEIAAAIRKSVLESHKIDLFAGSQSDFEKMVNFEDNLRKLNLNEPAEQSGFPSLVPPSNPQFR